MIQESLFYKSLQHPNSPYHTAPQSIKEYIKSLKPNTENFPQMVHTFQPRPSPKRFCTRKLKPTQKFYYCQQCSKDRQLDQMIYCQSCFDVKLHQGHKIQQKNVQTLKCSCDCGRKMRLNQAYFCSAHSGQNNTNVEIKQQEAQLFNQYFLSLFKIWAFILTKNQQKSNLFLKSIITTLCNLCSQSLYYTKLTIKILQNEIILKQNSIKILDKILQHCQFCQLLMQLVGDQQFLLQFGQYYMKKQTSQDLVLFYFNSFRLQLLDSQIFLMYMANKNIYYPDALNNYFEIAKNKNQQQRNYIITNLLQNISNKVQKQQYIDQICRIMNKQQFISIRSQKFMNNTLTKILSFYKKIPNTINQNQNKDKNKDKDKDKQIKNDEKLILKKSLNIINTIIYSKCNQNILLLDKVINDIYQNQNQQKQLKQNLQNFIQKICETDITQLMKQKYRKMFILILFIFDRHSKKQELLLKFWRKVIDQQKAFNQNIDKIYQVIGYFANSYRTFPILGVSNMQKQQQKQQNLQNQQILKQNLFKQYLYENKQISKKQIWNDYTKGWLKFNNCGKILKQLCQYNNGHDTFIYKSTKNYPNNLLKIPLQLSRNWENVRKIQISYNSPNFGSSDLLKKIMLILFKTPQFFNLFQKNFIKGLQIIEKQARTLEKWKQKGVGDNYVILILLIDKLCHGEEYVDIKQEIQSIKLNTQEYRFRFTQIGNEDKIKKMLCVDLPVPQVPIIQEGQQSPKKAQKTEEQIKNQQFLKKSQSKKQKLEQKLKQKRKNMLDKMKKQKSSVNQQEEQQNFCLSCKQREQKDNQFIILTNLSKGNTISKILHAEQSRTSTKISTNLHVIHLKCFKEIKKKNMQFQCILCKENINSFLPFKPNRATKLTLQICWNIFNAVLVNNFNIYETGSLFSNLLDALVESLGFTQLISAKKTKFIIKIKNKVDTYLLNMLQCLYSLSTNPQKQKYKQIYEKMRQNIKTCTKKQIQLFQLVILQAIFFRISGQIDIDSTIIEQLSKYMIEQQLKVLKNTLQFITNGNSDYLSSIDQLSMQKITEQQIAQNQQKSQQQLQLPTSLENISEIPQKKIQKQSSISQTIPQPGPEQLQKKQKIPQRKPLGINILTPPKKLTQLFKKSYLQKISQSIKCCSCQTTNQISSICLICRRLFCQKCQQDQIHYQIHLNNLISLDIQNSKLTILKNGKQQKYDIYYNDFMIQYKKDRKISEDSDQDDQLSLIKIKNNNKNKDKKGAGGDIEYLLNVNRFNQLVQKFYNLI